MARRGRDRRGRGKLDVLILPEADEGLRVIRARNNAAYRVVVRFILALGDTPTAGHELREEWAGYRAAHVYNDQYRVIWQVLETHVEILRVGLRFPSGTGGIYDEPPPAEPTPQ